MLSFSDSRSFSVSGLSAYSNFSAYESSVSQAGGTFKVGGHVTHELVNSYSVGRMEMGISIMCRCMKTAAVQTRPAMLDLQGSSP